MSTNNTDLDSATLANYRREIERAVASDERAKGATAAVFAALDRRDYQRRAMRQVLEAIAPFVVCDLRGGCGPTRNSEHRDTCPMSLMRKLLAR